MDKIKILITNGMDSSGLERLKSLGGVDLDFYPSLSRTQILDKIENAQIVIVRTQIKIDQEILARAKNLKLIQTLSVGLDHIDTQYAAKQKIQVFNTPGANAESAAQLTLLMILTLLRSSWMANKSLTQKMWQRDLFKGHEIQSKVLGIVGIGNVGSILTQYALQMGVKVIAFDIQQKQYEPFKDHPLFFPASDLKSLIASVDILSIHTPLDYSTQNLFNLEMLQKLQPGSFVVNCARGPIINSEALIECIDSGHIAAAAVDVFEAEPPSPDDPIINHPKVFCTPHIGGATHSAHQKISAMAANQIIHFIYTNLIKKENL